MTEILVAALTVTAFLLVILLASTGRGGATRVPPARPRRETDTTTILNELGDDADRIYR